MLVGRPDMGKGNGQPALMEKDVRGLERRGVRLVGVGGSGDGGQGGWEGLVSP